MRSIFKFVCLLFVILLTACSQETEREARIDADGFIELVQRENITTEGYGQYSYLYTNQVESDVKLWVEMIMADGDTKINEELFIQQSIQPGTMELEFHLQPNEEGELDWYIQLGEHHKRLITPNYVEHCVSSHGHEASAGFLRKSDDRLSIFQRTCSRENGEHVFTYALMMESHPILD